MLLINKNEKYGFEKLVYESCSVMSNSLRGHGLPGSSVRGALQARTLEGRRSLLQQILPTQESNQGLLGCGQILHPLSHQGRTQNKAENSKGKK